MLHCVNVEGRILRAASNRLRRIAQSRGDAVVRVHFGAGAHQKQGVQGMDCTVEWLPASGMAFSAQTGSGHLIVMDGAPDGGGQNLAPRPMETLLAGAGGCSAYDVVLILKRGRHDVLGCSVRLKAERAQTDPKVFLSIHFHFVVRGRALPHAAVERAIALSHERYCSATAMLVKTATITHSHEVVDCT